MKKTKSLLFIATLLVLLVGLSCINAVDTSNDTTQSVEKVATTQTGTDSVETPIKNIKKEETSTDYYVSDTSGSDSNSGTNDSPFKTLQTALDKTTTEGTYNIHIAEGTYKGLGNTNLTIDGNKKINIIGDGINKTVFDGQANYTITTSPGYVWQSTEVWWPYIYRGGDYAMTITRGDGLISLNGLTITNMFCPGGSAINAYTYAPVDNYANLVVDSVSFQSNHAGVGGAIRNNNGSTLIVNNSYFLNNTKSTSTGNNGAGIYNNGTTEVYNSLFDSNYARWSTILSDKYLLVVNCTFQNGVAYDGSSTYRYGTGIGANSGGADYYAPGFFMTDTQVFNCTFINNQECDIYVFEGNLVAAGNKFINSTGIYVNDQEESVSFNYTIDGNVFENMISSSVTQSLSTGNTTFAVNAVVESSNVTISNNNFTSENCTLIMIKGGRIVNNNIYLRGDGTSIELLGNNTLVENNNITKKITVEGDNNIIHNNSIKTDDEYAVYLTGKTMRNNSITGNELIAYSFVGDSSVNGTVNNIGRSTIENNMPVTPEDYIYVSFDITVAGEGTIRNPTTITDALTRVENNQIISVIPTKSQTLSDIDTININTNTVNENTDTFTITSLTDNFIFNRNNSTKQERIFNIAEGFEVTLDNLNFENIETSDDTFGGAVYTESDLNIYNCRFNNITATSGGAIYANGESNIQIINSTFKDVKASDEAIYLYNTGAKTLENNTYTNSSIETTTTINSEAVTRKNHINDTITINIADTTITHPQFYDENILSNIKYNIYINDELINTTTESTFTITPKTPENINLYIIPEFTDNPSNTLTFSISYDDKIKVELNTPDKVTFTNTQTTLQTTVIDEFANKVNTGKVSYYNQETLINTVNVENGTATCTLPTLPEGTYTITTRYTDEEETYESSNNTTELTVLDKIYVDLSLTTPSTGTRTNPTTIQDALTKIQNNQTIYILKHDQPYYINETIQINPETVQEGVNTFTIEGENTTLDGKNKKQIMKITAEFDITIKNMTFQNAKSNNAADDYSRVHGGAIYSDGNITLEYTNFYNNRADNSYGGAICSRNIKILEGNNFINNTARYGGAVYGENVTIIDDNHFINNTAYSAVVTIDGSMDNNDSKALGGAIFGVNTSIDGNNSFINNSARDYGGAIFSHYTYISGSNDFTNNSARYYGGSIDSMYTIIINNATFTESSACIGGVIITGTGVKTVAAGDNYLDMRGTPWGVISVIQDIERMIINSTFINCSSENEIFEFSSQNVILENNTYINCSIQVKNNTISLNPDTITPVVLNGEVIIDITNVTLVHPALYDEDILEELTYNVYINDDVKTTTNTNTATVTIEAAGDNNIYVTPTFSQSKSNIIYYDIEKDGLKNTVITAQEAITLINSTAEITVTVTDKSGELVTGEGIITIYNQDNEVIGTNTITGGTTTVTTTEFRQLGENPITITYNTTEKYNNQTNTSTVLVKILDVYVSPSVPTPQLGDMENPTTIKDALTKVAQNGIIHLLEDYTDTYNIDETISINSASTGVNTFKLQGETENIKFDGSNQYRILEIAPNYTIEIINISFMHGNNSAIYNQGNLTITGKSTHSSSWGSTGGAIQSTGNLTINGNHTFSNLYSGNGGVIHSSKGGNITINGNNVFMGNNADVGGVIWSNGANSYITINGTNIFKNNTLKEGYLLSYGGVIYLQQKTSHLIINGSNIFENNKVISSPRASGGAIYSAGETIIEGNNIFKGNLADASGGALFITNQLTITGENSFSNNQALGDGGTIYASIMTITGNNIFANSNATTGGIIYVRGAATAPTLIIDGATFENATATTGGAIYTASNKLSVQITNNNFKNITSTSETIELTTQNTQLLIKDNTYTNSTIQNTFTLTSPQQGQVTVTDTPITLETQLTLTNPQYYDEDILDDVEYQIFVNNENVYNTTETESTYTPTEYGTYTIQAKTTLLNTPSNTVTVNVNKYEITLDPITVSLNEAVDITATISLNDEASDISTGRVYFKVNGKVLRDSTTNKVIYVDVADGVATLTDYTVPDTWNDDTEIKAVYTGNDEVPEITSETVNPTINNIEEPEFTVADTTATAGSEVTITVTTKNLDAGKVVLKVNGKTVKADDGKLYAKVAGDSVTFTYTVPKTLKAGDYSIKAVYTSGATKQECEATLTVE